MQIAGHLSTQAFSIICGRAHFVSPYRRTHVPDRQDHKQWEAHKEENLPCIRHTEAQGLHRPLPAAIFSQKLTTFPVSGTIYIRSMFKFWFESHFWHNLGSIYLHTILG